jgi:hypothetical protein
MTSSQDLPATGFPALIVGTAAVAVTGLGGALSASLALVPAHAAGNDRDLSRTYRCRPGETTTSYP